MFFLCSSSHSAVFVEHGNKKIIVCVCRYKSQNNELLSHLSDLFTKKNVVHDMTCLLMIVCETHFGHFVSHSHYEGPARVRRRLS